MPWQQHSKAPARGRAISRFVQLETVQSLSPAVELYLFENAVQLTRLLVCGYSTELLGGSIQLERYLAEHSTGEEDKDNMRD
jgi:hypothetical protein